MQSLSQTAQPHENQISFLVIGAAMTVHKELGPGLLESVYEKCLGLELLECGLSVQRQVPIPIKYRDLVLEEGFRADLIVEDRILVELKSVQEILPIHTAQCISYLRMTGLNLCLLINFNVEVPKKGFRRLRYDTERLKPQIETL